jgi:hypothetical protein
MCVRVCVSSGLLGFQFLPELRDALAPLRVPLVQPLLRSSYRQYGVATLAQDVDDVDDLVATLTATLGRAPRVLLIGHSTGCQVQPTPWCAPDACMPLLSACASGCAPPPPPPSYIGPPAMCVP